MTSMLYFVIFFSFSLLFKLYILYTQGNEILYLLILLWYRQNTNLYISYPDEGNIDHRMRAISPDMAMVYIDM